MEDTNLIHELARIALGLLATAITAILSIYGPRVLRAVETRLGIDVPDPIVQQATQLALDAIAFAEERARALAKATGKNLLAGEKLNLAAKYFRDHAGAPVLELLRGHVSDWIEAKLGQVRGVPGATMAPSREALVINVGSPATAPQAPGPTSTGALEAQ